MNLKEIDINLLVVKLTKMVYLAW